MSISKSLKALNKKVETATSAHGSKTPFAQKAEVSLAQIDTYLKGKSSPTLEVVDRLADALGLETWQAVNGDPNPPVPYVRYTSEVQKRDARIAELERQVDALKVTLAAYVGGGLAEIVAAAGELNDDRRAAYVAEIRAEVSAMKGGFKTLDNPHLKRKT